MVFFFQSILKQESQLCCSASMGLVGLIRVGQHQDLHTQLWTPFENVENYKAEGAICTNHQLLVCTKINRTALNQSKRLF